MPLEQVSPNLASVLAANCSSSAAHLLAARSMPDSRTSFAAAMSFLVSPTAMNGTFDSKTGVPPLMARVDAVAVVILVSPGVAFDRLLEGCVDLLGKDMPGVLVLPIILFAGFCGRKGVFEGLERDFARCDKKSVQWAGIFSVLMYLLNVRGQT